MGLEGIFGECEVFSGGIVGEMVSDTDAAKIFDNRLNRNNKIEGHLVSVSKLREFLDAIDGVDSSRGIEYVRIWKGTSKKYGTCRDGSHPNEYYLEDLIMVPTYSNGDDVHAQNIMNDDELSSLKILSGLRPCPKLCSDSSKKELAPTYFHERFPDSRDTTNTAEEIDPYENYITCEM